MVVLDIDFTPPEGLLGEFFGLFVDVLYFSVSLDVTVFDLLLIVSEHGACVPIVVFFQ